MAVTEVVEKQNGTASIRFFVLARAFALFLGRPGSTILGDIQVHQISQTSDPWAPM